MDGYAQAEAVEHGHDRKHLVAGLEHGVGGDDLLCQRIEVQVGQGDSLLGSCGSAGVEDHRRIVGLPGNVAGSLVGHSVEKELLPPDDLCGLGHLSHLSALHDVVSLSLHGRKDVLHGCEDQASQDYVLTDICELSVELVQSEADHGLAQLKAEFDLLFTGEGVHHVGDASHFIDCVKHYDGLGRVGHADGHCLAFLYAD